jgi:HSP20 family molecular chaperone IbpA
MFNSKSSITLSVPETAKYLEKIRKNTIGIDDIFNQIEQSFGYNTNYPLYNLVKENETNYRLEIALAGFKRDEISVYTEINKLVVESKSQNANTEEYIHKGVATRSFSKTWTISEDIQVSKVIFEDGLLTVNLNKIIPESHMRKDWM